MYYTKSMEESKISLSWRRSRLSTLCTGVLRLLFCKAKEWWEITNTLKRLASVFERNFVIHKLLVLGKLLIFVESLHVIMYIICHCLLFFAPYIYSYISCVLPLMSLEDLVWLCHQEGELSGLLTLEGYKTFIAKLCI